MSADRNRASRWYLRMGDGKVYGPVSFDILLAWAGQARVGPGSEVSVDGTKWIPPETVPELGLEWMVVVEGREPYGPLHRAGVAQLVLDGSVSAEVRVRSARTGQELSAQALMAAIEVEERHRMETQLAQAREELRAAVAQSQQAAEAAGRERALREQEQAESSEREKRHLARVSALDQEARTLASAADRERSVWRERESELATQLDQAAQRTAALKDRASALEVRASSAEAALAAAGEALRERDARFGQLQAEANRQAAEHARQIETLTVERDTALQSNLDLQVQLEGETAAATEAAARHEAQVRAQSERIGSLEEQVGGLSESLAQEREAHVRLQKESDAAAGEAARSLAEAEQRADETERDRVEARNALRQVTDDLAHEREAHEASRKRGTELATQLDQAAQRIAALEDRASALEVRASSAEAALAAAGEALRERDARFGQLQAEANRQAAEHARQIETLSVERDTALQSNLDLQVQLEGETAAATEAAARHEAQARTQSERTASLEEQVGRLDESLAQEREAHEASRKRGTELATQLDQSAQRIAAMEDRASALDVRASSAEADLAAAGEALRERDARFGQLQAEANRQAAEHARQIETLSVERDTALQSNLDLQVQLEGETAAAAEAAARHEAQARTQSERTASLEEQVGRLSESLAQEREAHEASRKRGTELATQLEQAARQIAALETGALALEADLSAAHDAVRERESGLERIRAEAEAQASGHVRQVASLTSERNTAFQRVLNLQTELTQESAAAAEAAARHEVQERTQSERIGSLEEHLGALNAKLAQEREALARFQKEWETAIANKTREIAEAQRQTKDAEQGRVEAQTALRNAVDDLAKERETRTRWAKRETELTALLDQAGRQAAALKTKVSSTEADLASARNELREREKAAPVRMAQDDEWTRKLSETERQRDAALRELRAVREVLRMAAASKKRPAPEAQARSPSPDVRSRWLGGGDAAPRGADAAPPADAAADAPTPDAPEDSQPTARAAEANPEPGETGEGAGKRLATLFGRLKRRP